MMNGADESGPGSSEYAISIGEANIRSVFFVLPIMAGYTAIYTACWGWLGLVRAVTIPLRYPVVCVGLIIIGTLLHEAFHALTWAWAAKLPRKAFHFGFNIKGLAPYAHCMRPMSVTAYRLGSFSPGFILGVVPFIVGLCTGNGGWMSFGFLFTLAASGDFLMLWIARDIPCGTLVQDHPQKVGFEIIN